MVSLEGLTKVVDPSQLTADFDGSLDYNHEEWIEVSRQRERSDPLHSRACQSHTKRRTSTTIFVCSETQSGSWIVLQGGSN